jgi:amino acid adenylation domain-containing protein
MRTTTVDFPLVIFNTQILEEQRYWKGRLAQLIEPARLRSDYGRTATAPGRFEQVEFSIGEATWERLHKLANGNDFLIYTAVMAALQVTLHKYTGSRDVIVGSPARISGGDTKSAKANAVAIKATIDETASFRVHLLAVRTALLEAYRHQTYPFARVVKDLGLANQSPSCPLFDLALSMEGLHGPLPHLGCELVISLRRGHSPAGSASFDTSVFRRPTVECFLRNLLAFLHAALSDTSRPIAELSAVDDSECRRITVDWNATVREYPQERRIHELIEQQAARTADRLAVSAGSSTLSYRELDERANQLAWALADRGVRRGDRVAIWSEPSAAMIVGVLAVLKAGGSYVPIDASWPCERARWILDTLRIRTLLLGRGTLLHLHEIVWSLRDLRATICIDVDSEALPAEDIADRDAIRSVWDFVVETATDDVGAAGFISSFTGLPFSPAEVNEYRDHVLALVRPHVCAGARILEIGCGSGLIMFALAREVAEYVGLDASPTTQARNATLAAGAGLGGLRLVTGFADALDELVEESGFDVVLMASTAQFFPGPRYLQKVIAAAVDRLRPGGTLVVADVMDIRRKGEFAASLAEFERAHRGDPSIHTKTEVGNELHADPQFFLDLQSALRDLAQVDIHERSTGFDNELRFRFDVVLHKRTLNESAGGAEPPAPSRRIDTGWHVARYPATSPGIRGEAEDEAYVIHTSGSTGTPKGVAVRHRPVVNLIDWVNREFEVGQGDRLLFVTSLCFDLSVYDIFGILAAGATIEVASDVDRLEPHRLMTLIKERGITFWDSAPAALERLVPLFSPPQQGNNGPAKTLLRLVFLSGDWIPITLPDLIRSTFPGVLVTALGGATEATVWSNYYRIEDIAPHWVSIPYGRPIQNARYYILDPRGQPCPVGIPGDLHIGGAVLADGYVNQPELTAARFVADPFSDAPAARMYKTGDRAVFWEDGVIEFLGRLDQQVKIRGYRVEIAEVETALQKLASVGEAVVVARPTIGREKRLIAYVVPAEGSAPNASDFHRFLKELLPSYMIPAAFVIMDRMPLTPNGKVDRKGLPDPDAARPTLREGFVEPATETEQALADIWKEVLGVDAVGRLDNFFELGGNSLQATQILSRVRRAFDLELPLSRLFSAPRIADLAAAVAEAKASGSSAHEPGSVAIRMTPISPAAAAPVARSEELGIQ